MDEDIDVQLNNGEWTNYTPSMDEIIEFFYSLNNIEIIRSKINKTNVHLKDNTGDSFLHWATKLYRLDIIKFLVEEKNLNINILNKQGESALFVAAKKNYFNIAKYLIHKGIDTNIYDASLDTALLWASYYDHLDIIVLLVERGNANPLHCYKDGGNSLHWSAKMSSINCFIYLSQFIKDPYKKDNNGKTIYDLGGRIIQKYINYCEKKRKTYMIQYFHTNNINNTIKDYNVLKLIFDIHDHK